MKFLENTVDGCLADASDACGLCCVEAGACQEGKVLKPVAWLQLLQGVQPVTSEQHDCDVVQLVVRKVFDKGAGGKGFGKRPARRLELLESGNVSDEFQSEVSMNERRLA